MAAYNKFQAFVENLAEKVHNLGADALTIALTNTAPVATNSVIADITQISYTNLSSRLITTTSSAQTTGVYKLVLVDLVLTSTGGATGPFRYVVLFNDTPAAPLDPLIAWYDYGSAITLNAGETLTIDFDAANGVLQIS